MRRLNRSWSNPRLPLPQPSYEVYDYYHGTPTPSVSEPQPAEEPTPSEPLYHGRYPYGYGYEYDYEYSQENSAATPAEEVRSDGRGGQCPVFRPQMCCSGWTWAGIFSVAWGTPIWWIAYALEAAGIMSQVASVVQNLPIDEIRDDAARMMANAIAAGRLRSSERSEPVPLCFRE